MIGNSHTLVESFRININRKHLSEDIGHNINLKPTKVYNARTTLTTDLLLKTKAGAESQTTIRLNSRAENYVADGNHYQKHQQRLCESMMEQTL